MEVILLHVTTTKSKNAESFYITQTFKKKNGSSSSKHIKKICEGLVKKHKSEIQAEVMNELPLFGLIDEGLDQWKKAKEESKGFDHLWMLIFNWKNDASKSAKSPKFKLLLTC